MWHPLVTPGPGATKIHEWSSWQWKRFWTGFWIWGFLVDNLWHIGCLTVADASPSIPRLTQRHLTWTVGMTLLHWNCHPIKTHSRAPSARESAVWLLTIMSIEQPSCACALHQMTSIEEPSAPSEARWLRPQPLCFLSCVFWGARNE